MAQPKPFDPTTYRDYRPRDYHPANGGYRPAKAEGPVLTPVESRQGVISGRVLLILTTSLLLAGIAFVILYGTQT
jgi:hypothetical protein